MKEKEIDHLVEDFYGKISMSESKIDHILRNTPEQEVVIPFYRKGWFSYAAAACIAFLIVSVVITSVSRQNQVSKQTSLANQVINVHNMHLKPDVYAASLGGIQKDLGNSDFSIIPTSYDSLQNYRVLGGRHCAFDGIKAVHVVLMNQHSQKECCLYVLPDVGSLKKFRDAMINVDNRKVAFWHDNGRIYALYDPS